MIKIILIRRGVTRADFWCAKNDFPRGSASVLRDFSLHSLQTSKFQQKVNRSVSCLLARSCRLCAQAWALFKGKFREGIDKPDPPTWKTRLRCALNKSNDFEELVERSQLDISDPYKVYRIVPEGAKKSQSSKLSTHSCTHSLFRSL